jgi:hypothetical protein
MDIGNDGFMAGDSIVFTPEKVLNRLKSASVVEGVTGTITETPLGNSLEELNKLTEDIEVPVSNSLPGGILDNIPELDDNEVFIYADSCGIVYKPQKILIEDKIIILISSMDKKDTRFILYPAKRFNIYIKTVDKDVSEHFVYFSGINFSHSDMNFLVFHLAD